MTVFDVILILKKIKQGKLQKNKGPFFEMNQHIRTKRKKKNIAISGLFH